MPALGFGTYPMRGEQCYEAVRWARMIPIPGNGAGEVRPVWQE